MESNNIERYFRITDQESLQQLIQLYGLNRNSSLEDLSRVLSLFPYENFTKILKVNEVISAKSALRTPDEVLRDFLRMSTGGTCFSLTALFIALLSEYNFIAYPIMADRHYGTNTHCALFLEHENRLKLLDPGFMISKPVTLPVDRPVQIDHGFNRIELVPEGSGQRIDLYTITGENRKYRLTYRIKPVSREEFIRAWQDSFSWEMMTYPIYSRLQGDAHYYLQKDLLRIKRKDSKEELKLSKILETRDIYREFGINRKIYREAFSIIKHG